MKRYNPKDIETKWQKQWESDGIYKASDDSEKSKKYVLEYFPYPSGAAMHVGHVRNYTIGDVISRHARMSGYNVLHPMGWDAFGLPAENYAIKSGISPRKAVDENTTKFKKQLMQMGFSYDWSREIDSTDPKYYKWTQWFFLLLYKRGLAYQQESLQWWCPVDKTVLANEQVEAGKCWRCGSEVEKKSLRQWFFKITEYADRLLEGLEDLDWSEGIKAMQRNWIGKSAGAEIDFKIVNHGKLSIFTTRHDTQYGVTFLVLAPEHPLVKQITIAENKQTVQEYVKIATAKSDIERQAEEGKQKTGVFTGAFAINPANDEKIPIWVADYVLMGYGSGAVMGVPAHDDRDYEFAKKFGLEIRQVLETDSKSDFHSEGVVVNSGPYNGMRSEAMREKILKDFVSKNFAKEKVNYKIRDWLISRQRYWGAPIPIIHCPKDGAVAVPEDQLPVVLPEVKSYEPSGDGKSPLANVAEFVNTTCPKCGGPAERETDTMDGFACSSWYFLRFADPQNSKKAFDPAKAKFWLPVDDYIGGAEHAVMHLLYARFWTKVMYDEGLVNFQEPFKTLRNHGMILAPDGQKMSKSKGNTIEPDSIINQGYGADSIRIMELFIGPWNQSANWSVEGMGGSFRFLQRVWTITHEFLDDTSSKPVQEQAEFVGQLKLAVNRTTKKVTEDLMNLGFNTAISSLMELINEMYAIKVKLSFYGASGTWRDSIETLLQLLAPFAPHITEELWHEIGHNDSIHTSTWPTWTESIIAQQRITIAIQVNGKLRATFDLVPDSLSQQQIEANASNHPNVSKYLAGDIKKIIYVPGKLVNFVV